VTANHHERKSSGLATIPPRLKATLPALLVLVAAIGGAWLIIAKYSDNQDSASSPDVKVPQFSRTGQLGEKVFAENCATCHGENAAGSQNGPPLVHKVYEPGHHSDGAFFLAMQRGVRQHHWRFGNMPPQPQVSTAGAKAIVRYIRELQVANGIGRR